MSIRVVERKLKDNIVYDSPSVKITILLKRSKLSTLDVSTLNEIIAALEVLKMTILAHR